jgi:hypothetical protein
LFLSASITFSIAIRTPPSGNALYAFFNQHQFCFLIPIVQNVSHRNDVCVGNSSLKKSLSVLHGRAFEIVELLHLQLVQPEWKSADTIHMSDVWLL